ncbi:hypothetical protein DRE_01583 [Drechslerella stenobrocha 248]|uniref:glucan 1,4-alpha-glucosidase n=1 Tax=Drechslerella stenobrocha 248 TaxID=1043628 RepID=W7HII5_9PEZI|nr:hypothetical protein DRE_01583 [Drechslerella stenobrocha 248]
MKLFGRTPNSLFGAFCLLFAAANAAAIQTCRYPTLVCLQNFGYNNGYLAGYAEAYRGSWRSRTLEVYYQYAGREWTFRANYVSDNRDGYDTYSFGSSIYPASQFYLKYTVDRAVYWYGPYNLNNGGVITRTPTADRSEATAAPKAKVAQRSAFESWLSKQYEISEAALKRNIGSSSNTLIPKGVVVASPSTSEPDYYFQWIRDASCVMEHLVDNYLESGKDLEYILDWIKGQKKLQRVDNPSGGYTTGGLGEPKFHVDGTAYNDPWGRPQRDGPALRANTIMKFASRYLSTDASFVRSQLYDSAPQGQSQTVIKADLDYVVSSWSQSSFDLWEEIQGQHYFTIIVSYRAMVEGEAFARKMGDHSAADLYKQTANNMLDTIRNFWSAEKGYIVETHGAHGRSGLDCGVLLGVLRAPYVFTPGSEQTLATTEAMLQAFQWLYPLNQRDNGLGFGIGRYPEDTYDGVSTSGRGNPWFICTATVAHTLFAAAADFSAARSVSVTPTSLALFKRAYGDAKTGVYKSGSSDYDNILAGFKRLGDNFLDVVKRHAFVNGSMSEQFDRENGYNRGARDLTWSYEALLGAMRARMKL